MGTMVYEPFGLLGHESYLRRHDPKVQTADCDVSCAMMVLLVDNGLWVDSH